MPYDKKAWNHFIVVVGHPGSGKSTYALRRASELRRTTKEMKLPFAYVVVHDVEGSTPDEFPDGTPTGIVRHGTVLQAQRGYFTDPKGLHVVPSETIDEPEQIARDLFDNTGVPAILYIDEIVLVEGAEPERLSPQMRKLITQRRHRGMGVIFTGQSACDFHYKLLGMATEVTMFHTDESREIKRLRDGGIPERVTERLPELPPYHALTYYKVGERFGEVSEVRPDFAKSASHLQIVKSLPDNK